MAVLRWVAAGQVPGGRRRHRPFGEHRVEPEAGLSDRGFTGHRELGGIGLVHMRARLYSAELGRFVQPDSIVPNPAAPQDLNRYSYSRNSPLVYVDPSGHLVDSPDNIREQAKATIISTPYWWPDEYRPTPETVAESLVFVGVGLPLIAVGGPGFVELAAPAIHAYAGTLSLRSVGINGAAGVGGYVAGQWTTGAVDDITLADLGVAFVGNALTPGGFGKSLASRLATEALLSGASNTVQSGFSATVIHGEGFCLADAAVAFGSGAAGGLTGELAVQKVEPVVKSGLRGAARGSEKTVQTWINNVITTGVDTFWSFVVDRTTSLFDGGSNP